MFKCHHKQSRVILWIKTKPVIVLLIVFCAPVLETTCLAPFQQAGTFLFVEVIKLNPMLHHVIVFLWDSVCDLCSTGVSALSCDCSVQSSFDASVVPLVIGCVVALTQWRSGHAIWSIGVCLGMTAGPPLVSCYSLGILSICWYRRYISPLCASPTGSPCGSLYLASSRISLIFCLIDSADTCVLSASVIGFWPCL